MGLRFCNEVVVAAEQIYPTALEEAVENKAEKTSTENNGIQMQQRHHS